MLNRFPGSVQCQSNGFGPRSSLSTHRPGIATRFHRRLSFLRLYSGLGHHLRIVTKHTSSLPTLPCTTRPGETTALLRPSAPRFRDASPADSSPRPRISLASAIERQTNSIEARLHKIHCPGSFLGAASSCSRTIQAEAVRPSVYPYTVSCSV